MNGVLYKWEAVDYYNLLSSILYCPQHPVYLSSLSLYIFHTHINKHPEPNNTAIFTVHIAAVVSMKGE
jgi:hypothetical protein